MTAAEAVVEGMLAHGIETIYALPGVQNDHLFAALADPDRGSGRPFPSPWPFIMMPPVRGA